MERISKFEMVRLIGERANQLSLGAPPMVDIEDLTDAIQIAEKELRENKIPLVIRRVFPNGNVKEIFMYKD